MTNSELHDQAQQLADTRSAYSLARDLLIVREVLSEARGMMDNQPRGFSGMIKRIDAVLSAEPGATK